MSVRMEFHTAEVLARVRAAAAQAVEIEAAKVAAEARRLCPVGTVTKGRRHYFLSKVERLPDGSRRRSLVKSPDTRGTSWTARKPGTLRDSIISKVRWSTTSPGVCVGYVKAGYDRKHRDGDPNAFYAPFVEYGTRKMRAQPFMRPAGAKARLENISTAMRSSLGDA